MLRITQESLRSKTNGIWLKQSIFSDAFQFDLGPKIHRKQPTSSNAVFPLLQVCVLDVNDLGPLSEANGYPALVRGFFLSHQYFFSNYPAPSK